ncbi:hypothetical protein [Sessilibacter sp. MAH4]
MQGSNYTTTWVSSLAEVGEHHWQTCFPEDDILRSYKMQQVYEAAHLSDVKFHYLLIKNTSVDCVVGLLPCFEFRLSMTDVAPQGVQNAVAQVRKIFPNFLRVSAFVTGSPIAICDDLIGINPAYRQQSNRILSLAFTEFDAKSQQLKKQMVVVKEIRQRYLDSFKNQLSESYLLGESPPTSFAYVGEIDGKDYLHAFRNRYRSSIKGYLNKFAKTGLRWEIVQDFGEHAETMCNLYLNVLNHSKVKFERLTPDFFRAANSILGEQSSALLCFEGDNIIAMELIIQGKQMHPIYLGMDYQYLQNSGLYFNCLIRLLQEAENRGSFVVELGQTSYEAKSNFGICLEKLYVAIKYNNRLANGLISLFKNQLFPAYQPLRERNLFNNTQAHRDKLDQALAADREPYQS